MKICKNCNAEYETGKFCKKCGSELVDKEEQVLVCSKCGTPLEPSAKFCPECGTKVSLDKLVCSHCGMELKPGSKFCQECGTKVGEETNEENPLSDNDSVDGTTETSSVLLDVTLTYAEKNKKKIISVLENCGFELGSAEEIVECLPFTIKEGIPEREALSIKNALEEVGAEVELEYAGAEEQFIQVVLESIGPSNLQILSKLQEVCKYNLKRSKFIVGKIPTIIKEACTKYEADVIKKEFEAIGAEIEFEYIHLVDLGLPGGLLWADCNVGASKPEDFGNYFTWGDVNPVHEKGYIQESKCRKIDMYSLRAKGITDSENNLTAAYDAASTNWGNKWRTPSREDFEVLLKQCSWTGESIDGAEGCKIVGPNGNSIFLPIECYTDDNYWTSTGDGVYECSTSLRFGSSSNSCSSKSYNYAAPIRPVKRKMY